MDGATSAATLPRKYIALPRSSSMSSERAARSASMCEASIRHQQQWVSWAGPRISRGIREEGFQHFVCKYLSSFLR